MSRALKDPFVTIMPQLVSNWRSGALGGRHPKHEQSKGKRGAFPFYQNDRGFQSVVSKVRFSE